MVKKISCKKRKKKTKHLKWGFGEVGRLTGNGKYTKLGIIILIMGIILILVIGGIIFMNKGGLSSLKIEKNIKESIISASEGESKDVQNGIILSPNLFIGWNYYMVGNESVLYDVKSLTKDKICIIPKDVSLKPITQEEPDLTKPIKDKEEKDTDEYEMKEVVYSYPISISMYGISKTSKTTLNTKSLTTQKEIDNSICFDLNNSNSLLYKLGEESIVISGLSNYASTNTNITQENLFTHLNLTDAKLVLYMPFDVIQDSANKTYDYSNNSNDGTIGNTTAGTQPTFNSTGGVYGGDYQFDGSNDNIQVPDSSSINLSGNSFSIGVWIYFKNLSDTAADNDDVFVRKIGTNTGYHLRLLNGLLLLSFYDLSGTQRYDYDAKTWNSSDINQWWHLVAVYNGTHILHYRNGVEVDSVYKGAYSVLGAGVPLLIGKYENALNSPSFLNGSMDEIMIFNRSLSATEVAQIYNATYSRFYPVGEMNFTSNNFGTNNTVNITISNCQQYNGSSIRFKVNNGAYSILNSSCMFDNYNMAGDLTSASVVLQLNSSLTNFYSPLIVGNITLNSAGDTTPPTYSQNSTNNTVAGQITRFGINVTDNSALNPNGRYVFSTNNTGANLVNDTPVNFIATPDWANVTKTLNATAGKVIGYQWYFNDSAGNRNSTPVYILTTALDCGTLSTANTTYTLTQNVTSTETCFTITAVNVTLDCNNFWINYSTGGADKTYGVYSSQFNTTIKNCNIYDGNWTSNITTRYGIYFKENQNGTILNNYVNVNNSRAIYLPSFVNFTNVTNNTVITKTSRGIQLESSSNNNILTNNNVTTNSGYAIQIYDGSNYNTLINNTGTSTSSYGIYVYDSDYLTLINNTGTSTSSYGIYFGGDNGILTNNTGTGYGDTGSHGLYIKQAHNNILTNNTFNSNESYGVRLDRCTNTTFIGLTATAFGTAGTGDSNFGFFVYGSNDTIIRDCINISGADYDVYYYNVATSFNNTFINCSYSTEDVNGATNQLIRAWYYQAYVNYSNGSAASDANVTSYNVSNIIQFTENTNASGWIQRKEVIEYNNTAGTRSYYNNYTINASKTNYTTDNNIWNFTTQTNKINDWFTLENQTTCGTLSTANTTYTLTNNVTSAGTCFTVTAQNITLNCNNFWINYSTGGVDNTYGIYTAQFNTTVKNCNVLDGSNWSTGTGSSRYAVYFNTAENGTLFNNSVNASSRAISLYDSNYSNLTRNTAKSNASYGILLRSSNNNTLINNTVISAESSGLYLTTDSSYNTLTNNTGTSLTGAYGIRLYDLSNNNILTGNTGTSNSHIGIDLNGASNNTLINNTAKSNANYGMAIVSYSNNTNLTNNIGISNESYAIRISTASGMNAIGNNGTSRDSTGIRIDDSGNSTFINNTGLGGGYGIAIGTSSNITLINNTGTGNGASGIYLSESSNNSLFNNTGTGSGDPGIYLSISNDSILTGNTGIGSADMGIRIEISSDNSLTNNKGTSSTSTGIYIVSSDNQTLLNNTGTSTSGYGLYLNGVSNSSLTNNNGTSTSGVGIYFDGDNNLLTNNTGIGYGDTTSYGLYIKQAHNNILTNNTFNSNESYGVRLDRCTNTTFIGLTATAFGTAGTGDSNFGFYVYGSNDTIIRDCINISGADYDVYYNTISTTVNNTFINCSYDTEDVNGATNQLIRKWYYQAKVNDSVGSPVADANVTAYNVSNIIQFTEQTNATGWIQRKEVIDYINTGGTRVFWNNYTINASKTNYTTDNNVWNFTVQTNKIDDWFTLLTSTCFYSSGNWNINCSESCIINTNYDVGGNNISIIGMGNVTVSANISNYNKLHIEGTSSTNICRVRCVNGGCFKN